MRLSLSEISTVNASFAQDVAAYAAAGFDGIGIWEMKLPEDDAANLAMLRGAGLAQEGEVGVVVGRKLHLPDPDAVEAGGGVRGHVLGEGGRDGRDLREREPHRVGLILGTGTFASSRRGSGSFVSSL